MAGVTSEILSNMLRSSLTDLKSFVEILNAELTEEGQGEESRITHRDDISRVLQSFGECEAYLDKSSKCLQDVEAKINSHFDDEPRELIEQKALHNEIAEIIKIIDGKERRDDDDRPLPNIDVDENKIGQQLENVEDILNEFHPLKLHENAEDDDANEEEEDRISKRLEMMQKKAMSKLEKRMSSVGTEDDEEFAARLENDDELTDSSDEEAIDYDSFERCENRQRGRNEEAKKNMDARLKELWTDYKAQLANVQPHDTKELFTEALNNQRPVDFQNLKYFSQFNNSILELFSKEAIVVVGSNINYVDPISKKEITHPVRNKICNHIYEKDTIYGILEKKTKMRCPLPGCSCRSFTINDLEEDEGVATRINQSLARKKIPTQQDTEDMETEDEDEDDDAIDVDTENDDTQSQELF